MKTFINWGSLFVLLLLTSTLQAARVDTLQIYSKKMQRNIETLVIYPTLPVSSERIPALYLLHGYSGDAHSWYKSKPELKNMADRDHILIVCPDGENSWYWDSPTQSASQFETFVSKELVYYIDTHYPTRRDHNSRAITGLSMGGHGAFWLAIRHQDVFGACGSMSGGVDIRPFPEKWEMSKQLGKKENNQALWDSHTVMTQLNKLKNGNLAITFDCGSDDFFFTVNCKLHQELTALGIFHDFTIRPGKHNWIYWNNSIEYHWLFFKRFFNGHRTRIQ